MDATATLVSCNTAAIAPGHDHTEFPGRRPDALPGRHPLDRQFLELDREFLLR